MSTRIAPQHPFPLGPFPVASMETKNCGFLHFSNALFSGHDNATALCNDRFNYWFFDKLNNAVLHYAYIQNFPSNFPYFWRFCRDSGKLTVHICDSHPIGALWVCDTVKLCIYPMFSDFQCCQMKREADRVLHNYRQHCFIRQYCGISYECYLTNIIDALIAEQDSVDRHTDTDLETYIVHK